MKAKASAGKPRVLVIFGSIPLLGHERGNIQVFNALKERGVEALFVTHKEYGHEHIQPELDRLGHRWTVATYPRLFSRGMDLQTWVTRLRSATQGLVEFWRIGRKFKPTHVHVGHEMHFLMMLPAIKLLGVPVVYRVGDAPQQHRSAFLALWRYVIVPNVTRFVGISYYIRSLLLEAGAPPEKISVIYNYPPTRNDAPEPLSLGAEPFDGVTVAYMGQLSEEKGVGLLVEAAIGLCRERDDVRFFLAGDYTWQNPFAEALIQQVEELCLSGRIRFLGYVEDIPGLLAAADIHVVPSLCTEALSNVVPEAKMAGVPSVVFASGGIPELIEDGVDGWVCAEKTAKGLREGLERLLALPASELNEMGSAARASMGRLGITKQAFADAWLAVYDGAGRARECNVVAGPSARVRG